MGQVLHGWATTTHAVRTAIQRSKAPLKELAARHGLNHKTVAKWRKRAFVNVRLFLVEDAHRRPVRVLVRQLVDRFLAGSPQRGIFAGRYGHPLRRRQAEAPAFLERMLEHPLRCAVHGLAPYLVGVDPGVEQVQLSVGVFATMDAPIIVRRHEQWRFCDQSYFHGMCRV